MKTFISDLIPKIARYSDKLDNLTLLTNQHWVALGELSETRIVYIFRPNGDLLVSRNGIVEKARWEYLGQESLLLETKAENYLFKQDFNDGNVLALRVDSSNEYVLLVNESRYNSELNSLEAINHFLRSKYLENNLRFPLKQKTTHISYELIDEREKFDIAFGTYKEFSVKYMDGIVRQVYQGKRSGKYYYLCNGLIYFDSLEETIIAYYNFLNPNN
jgi:hypothetical protein